jgi:hypothetical protein
MDPNAFEQAWLSYLWRFLFVGYLFTIAIETPVLVVGLSRRHPLRHRLFAGVWLTACTYPVVVLVLPQLIDTENHRWLFLAVAETFAPVAECALFWAAFGKREERWKSSMWRDLAVVVLANLASFGLGEVAHERKWFDPFVPPPVPAIPEGAGEGEAVRDRPRHAGPQDPFAVFDAVPRPRARRTSRSLPTTGGRPTLPFHYKSARFPFWG